MKGSKMYCQQVFKSIWHESAWLPCGNHSLCLSSYIAVLNNEKRRRGPQLLRKMEDDLNFKVNEKRPKWLALGSPELGTAQPQLVFSYFPLPFKMGKPAPHFLLKFLQIIQQQKNIYELNWMESESY